MTCTTYRILTKDPDSGVTAPLLKAQLKQHIEKFLGTEGSSRQFDIIKYDPQLKNFILRCDSKHYVQLRAALTVASTFQGKPCNYNIIRASSNLLSLTANSRTYQHHKN